MDSTVHGSRLVLRACTVDLHTGLLFDGREGRLTTRERQLAERLARQPGTPVSRADLFSVFGYHPDTRSRAVDKAMSSLRAKLEVTPSEPDHFVTVQNVGYVFHVSATARSEPGLDGAFAVFDTFYGRERELGTLAEWLTDEPGVVQVLGPGGIGKTRLAVEAVRRVAEPLAGNARFVDFSASANLPEAALAIAERLGAHLGQEEPARRIGDLLAQEPPTLWVWDHVDAIATPLATALATWMQVAPRHVFLVTSRVTVPLRGRTIELGGLEPAAAVEMFLGRSGTGREEGLDELMDELDWMPLAIELAAARGRVCTLPQLRVALAAGHLSQGAADARHPSRHHSLGACLQASWALLEPPGRRALVALSVFVGSVPVSAAHDVLTAVGVDPEAALATLLDPHLVTRVESRLQLMQSVRAFARQQLDGVRLEAERAHGQWVAGLVDLNHSTVIFGATLQALADEIPDLIVAHERARLRGAAEVVVRSAVGAWVVTEQRGPSGRALPLLEAALEHARDPAESCALLECLGKAHRQLGDGDSAMSYLARAVDVAMTMSAADPEEAELALNTGHLHRVRAWVSRDRASEEVTQATLGRARVALLRAIELARRTGEVAVEARAARELLEVLFEAGSLQEVRNRGPATASLLRQVDLPHNEALALAVLARAHRRLGDQDAAEICIRESIEVFGAMGKSLELSNALRTLGCIVFDLGRLREALAAFERCLELDRKVGSRHALGNDHCNVAEVYTLLGMPTQAYDHYAAALSILRVVGDRRLEARTLGHLAALDHQLGRLDAARDRCAEAHSRVGESDDAIRRSIVATEAGVLIDSGAPAQAESLLLSALRAGSGPSLAQRGRLMALLGRATLGAGDLGAAREVLTEASVLLDRVGAQMDLATATEDLAQLEMCAGDLLHSRELWGRALASRRRAGHALGEAMCRCGLAAVELAHEGASDSIRAALDGAEAVLREARHVLGLARVLAVRARLEGALDQTHERDRARVEARQIARECGLSAEPWWTDGVTNRASTTRRPCA